MVEPHKTSNLHDPAHITEKSLARGYLAWLGILTAISIAGMIACVLFVRWYAPDLYDKLHF